MKNRKYGLIGFNNGIKYIAILLSKTGSPSFGIATFYELSGSLSGNILIMIKSTGTHPSVFRGSMSYRLPSIAGILAVFIYLVAVGIGSTLRPGYSQIGNFVSELIETRAPNKGILNPLFIVYNFLTGVFAVGLFFFVQSDSPTGSTNLGTASAIVLALEAVFGLITVFFPQDIRGTAMTPTGTMHIILAGLSSLATMGAMLLFGLWALKVPGMTGYGWYSLVSVVFVFISGGLAAYTGSTNSPILGLMERMAIGGFLQWMLVLGIKLFSLS